MPPIAFYFLATLAIVASLVMIFQRHPLTAAVALVTCFLGLAGLYALLLAPLLAILQIFVYAGAIMALVVFVIMLLNVRDEDLPREPHLERNVGIGLAIAVPLFMVLYQAIGKFSSEPVSEAELVARFGSTTGHAAGPKFGGTEAVGHHLFTQFVFPFEIISLLLTVAVVGVVVLAKRRI